MNRALQIKNWSDGGNNYVLKATAHNKWSGFQESIISDLSKKFNDDFNIVIWTEKDNDDDYYCIPFKVIKNVFLTEHKTTGKFPNRWTAIIRNHRFLMHSNSELSIDISSFYAKPLISLVAEIEDDFFIENAKAEISIRLKQSKFRKGVLKNFGYKCALSSISETSLLTASHIIPWSHNKDCRLDTANGICLYNEYDYLFDKGFMTFSDDLKVIIMLDISKLSSGLRQRLESINGMQLQKPNYKPIKESYLDYHRSNIFRK